IKQFVSRDIPHVTSGRRAATVLWPHAHCMPRHIPNIGGESMNLKKALVVGVSMFCIGATVQAGETFDAVKSKGFVQCGVHTGLPGFGIANSKGEWEGIDVGLCKAI